MRSYDHGLKLIGNDMSRGGQLGVHGSGANILIKGNKIHDNNTEDFNRGSEAGGLNSSEYGA